MQERGVEVLELHDLLAETSEDRRRASFVLDRRITANSVGIRPAASSGHGWTRCRRKQLAAHLIGGIAISDLPEHKMQDAC